MMVMKVGGTFGEKGLNRGHCLASADVTGHVGDVGAFC